MLAYEWKKMLLYRRGLWLVIVFLAAELLGTVLFTQPFDRELEDHRSVYEQYLRQVEGQLTDEKRDYIETEMSRLNTAYQSMESLKSAYYAGQIAKEEYRSRFDQLQRDYEAYPGFAKLYSQYIYVREAPQSRFFLYTGGWERLLNDRQPDYPMLLLLVLLITPIFCSEYSSRMDQLLLTQKRSAALAAACKVCTAFLTAAALTAIVQGFRLGFCAIRFGLPNGHFPLRSVFSFGSANWDLSLWQAFWLQFGLKELGFLYCTMLILLLSALLRKFSLALMAGIALLPLPLLTVANSSLFLKIPGPWALAVGSIFLSAPEMDADTLAMFAALSVSIMFLAFIIVQRRNSNAHRTLFKLRSAALCLLCALLLGGCGDSRTPSTFFNCASAAVYSGSGYTALHSQEHSVLIDQRGGETCPLPVDAFSDETVFCSSCFYAEGGNLYYIVHTAPYTNAIGEYTLMELDPMTMSEKECFRWKLEQRWFFGLLDAPDTDYTPMSIHAFFLHNGRIFYDMNGDLFAVDPVSGFSELYMKGISTDYAYDGARLYYTDDYHRLVMRDLDSGEETVSEAVIASRFLLTPEGILFLNLQDGRTLYRWAIGSECAEKLNDTPALGLYWDEDYLWITALEDYARYRMDHNGENVVSVDQAILQISDIFFIPPEGNYLYQFDEAGTIIAVDKGTLNVTYR